VKVLVVTEYFPRSADCEIRGGVEARSFYLSRELARNHDVTVICAREPDEPIEEHFAGMTVRRCGPERGYQQGGSLVARAAFLAAAVATGRSIKADVVDGYNFIAYLAASQISRLCDVPRIATYHDVWVGEWIKHLGLLSGVVGEVMERVVLAQHWDHIIANSAATRAKLIAVGARATGIEVVHNGIALDEFTSVRAPKYDRPTICYVGRLVRYKRVDDLLHALTRVRRDVPEVMRAAAGARREPRSPAACVVPRLRAQAS
jgi:glycosyltransferase involved in cell wall biosynthesis